jgi:hypothetical protein
VEFAVLCLYLLSLGIICPKSPHPAWDRCTLTMILRNSNVPSTGIQYIKDLETRLYKEKLLVQRFALGRGELLHKNGMFQFLKTFEDLTMHCLVKKHCCRNREVRPVVILREEWKLY